MNSGLTSLLFKIIVGLLLAATPYSLCAQQTSEDDSCCVSPEIKRQIQFAVRGGVNSPGGFVVEQCVRLNTAITLAGGIVENGGPFIWIRRGPGNSISILPFPLGGLSNDEQKTNPYLKSGDVVYVSEPGPKIIVIGAVFLPQALALKTYASGPDQTLTVSLAVAITGGTLRNADLEKVSVVRQLKDNQKLIIRVNLKLVNKLLAEDIVLQENDIVCVPNKTGMEKMGIIRIFRGSLSSVPYVIR